MAFGYDTVAGWLPATYPAVLADLQDRYKSETSANVDVDNGPAADMLRTVASMLTDAWQDQEGAYNSKFISAAPGTGGVSGGSALENLLTPKIGPKLSAVESTVVLPLTAAAGPDVNVPAGHTVVVAGESVTWSLTSPVVIPGGGSIDGTFEYAETGPKKVIAGTSWTIVTPVTGWVSVGPNAADAIPGRNAETDAEYRERYRQSIQNNIIQAVRQVQGVTSAKLIEWQFGERDAFWGLSHWLEVLVVGGSDTDVATAINGSRAKGVNTVGNTSVSLANSDYLSGSVVERFSRAVLVSAYVDVTITKGEDYPADLSASATAARVKAIKAAVVAHFDSLQPGQDTSGFKLASYILNNAGIPGIDNIVVKVDTVDPPVNTGTLAVAIRDQLTVDSADVDVTGA